MDEHEHMYGYEFDNEKPQYDDSDGYHYLSMVCDCGSKARERYDFLGLFDEDGEEVDE